MNCACAKIPLYYEAPFLIVRPQSLSFFQHAARRFVEQLQRRREIRLLSSNQDPRPCFPCWRNTMQGYLPRYLFRDSEFTKILQIVRPLPFLRDKVFAVFSVSMSLLGREYRNRKRAVLVESIETQYWHSFRTLIKKMTALQSVFFFQWKKKYKLHR